MALNEPESIYGTVSIHLERGVPHTCRGNSTRGNSTRTTAHSLLRNSQIFLRPPIHSKNRMILSRAQQVLWLVAALAMILFASTSLVLADQQSPITNVQYMDIFVGDWLLVTSTQNSIQRVFLQGNLTAANYTQPAQYPTNEFTLTSSEPGTYDLKILFDLQTSYTVNLYVQSNQSLLAYSTSSHASYVYLGEGGQPKPNPNPFALASNQSTPPNSNSTSYYLSGGPSELDVSATFLPRQYGAFTPASAESAPTSFGEWIGSFGQAFPLWVKLLYFALGIQFFAVGGLWIRRESSRKESTGQQLDAGNKVFLWLDIACKFLLTSFIVIMAIMGGELLILFILRFMFLVSLSLLSLWDLFVVGFAAGILVIAYLMRFVLEKAFDLKPLEEE